MFTWVRMLRDAAVCFVLFDVKSACACVRPGGYGAPTDQVTRMPGLPSAGTRQLLM